MTACLPAKGAPQNQQKIRFHSLAKASAASNYEDVRSTGAQRFRQRHVSLLSVQILAYRVPSGLPRSASRRIATIFPVPVHDSNLRCWQQLQRWLNLTRRCTRYAGTSTPLLFDRSNCFEKCPDQSTFQATQEHHSLSFNYTFNRTPIRPHLPQMLAFQPD